MSTDCSVCLRSDQIVARFTCGHFAWCQRCALMNLGNTNNLVCAICGVNKSIIRFPVRELAVTDIHHPAFHLAIPQLFARIGFPPNVSPGYAISSSKCFCCWSVNCNTRAVSCLHFGWCRDCSQQLQNERFFRCHICQRDREIVAYPRPYGIGNGDIATANPQIPLAHSSGQSLDIPRILDLQVHPSNQSTETSRRRILPRTQNMDSRVPTALGLRETSSRNRLHNAQEFIESVSHHGVMNGTERVYPSVGLPPSRLEYAQVNIADNKCCFCFQNERNIHASCGHIGWCIRCVQMYMSGTRQLCPICDGEREVVLNPTPPSNLNQIADESAEIVPSVKKRKISKYVEQPQQQQSSSKVEVEIPEDLAQTCCVCLDNDRTTAFNPCGHRCVCADCAREVFKKKRVCPLCQTTTISILRIYL